MLSPSVQQFSIGKNYRCTFLLWYSYSHISKATAGKWGFLPSFSWQYSCDLRTNIQENCKWASLSSPTFMIGLNIEIIANKWKWLLSLQMPKLLIQIYLFPLIIFKNLQAHIQKSGSGLQYLIFLSQNIYNFILIFWNFTFVKVNQSYTHAQAFTGSVSYSTLIKLLHCVEAFLYLEMEITELASWSWDKDQIKWYIQRAGNIAWNTESQIQIKAIAAIMDMVLLCLDPRSWYVGRWWLTEAFMEIVLHCDRKLLHLSLSGSPFPINN